MYPHHAETIQNLKQHFESQPQVLALLLSGSIAHGFESEDSDVDILIIVTEEEYQSRQHSRTTTFFNTSLCKYPEGIFGYVDGKYLSISFIRQVAEKGSEPARFAFDGVKILFSKIDLQEDLRRVVAYPVAEKEERIRRFRFQFEAWNWFCGEARKKNNQYLLGVAVSKLLLFGGRLILAHNEMLYPFHKWFLRVLESAPDKPDGLLPCMHKLSSERSVDNINEFYQMVGNFRDWNMDPTRWGAQFMVDSEMNWLHGHTPVDDL
jgi:hypothetical protein